MVFCRRRYTHIYMWVSSYWCECIHNTTVWAGSDSTSLNLSVYFVFPSFFIHICFVALTTIIIIKRVVILFVVLIWEQNQTEQQEPKWRENDKKKNNNNNGNDNRKLCHNMQATCIDTIKQYENMKIDITDQCIRIHAFMLSFINRLCLGWKLYHIINKSKLPFFFPVHLTFLDWINLMPIDRREKQLRKIENLFKWTEFCMSNNCIFHLQFS